MSRHIKFTCGGLRKPPCIWGTFPQTFPLNDFNGLSMVFPLFPQRFRINDFNDLAVWFPLFPQDILAVT